MTIPLVLVLLVLAASPVLADESPSELRELQVTATAYNSVEAQTNSQPNVAAWGDRLEPGMKAIAVSRDLIPLGLTRGAKVRIDGLAGEFVVLDKMAKRWTRKIDIYMGEDVGAAKQWGRRRLRIFWDVGDTGEGE